MSAAHLQSGKKRLLFVVDDGWRYERRELLFSMQGSLDFDVATHDDSTYQYLKDDFPVIRLRRYPVTRNPFYLLTTLFARGLDTSIVRSLAAIHRRQAPLARRCLLYLRYWCGRAGIQPYSFHQALAFFYRRSRKYRRILKNYSALMFSPVNTIDKRIVYEARRDGKQIICFVYSWDNPLKDNEFPPDASAYLVWNEACRDEVMRLYGVPAKRILVVGPVQFEFLLRRKYYPVSEDAKGKYVLFACAVGWHSFWIEQEIRLIRLVRRLLDEVDRGVRLLVRPYPFSVTEDQYAELRGKPGIEVADFGTLVDWRVEVDSGDLEEKIRQIERAECLVHIGSTIALEASYTETPIIQIAFNPPGNYRYWEDLRRVMENDHLRFVVYENCPNIADSEEKLKTALADILSGRSAPYRNYSELLRRFARPLNVPSYHRVFIERLKACLE